MSGLFKTFHQIRDDTDLGDSTLVDEVQETRHYSTQVWRALVTNLETHRFFSVSSDQATWRNSWQRSTLAPTCWSKWLTVDRSGQCAIQTIAEDFMIGERFMWKRREQTISEERTVNLPPPPMVQQPLVGQGLLSIEASRPHTAGPLWTMISQT